MNRQLNLELKNFNFLDKLAVDYWVDAVDEQRWKIAKIVSIKSYAHRHVVSLHFDGFPDKWDEDFQLPASTKLAPFRRYTTPYTGPQGYSRLQVTRASPNLDFSGPSKELSRLSSKKQLKAQFINQTFRGEIFVLVDNILTKKTQYSEEIYKNCTDFFKLYIKSALYVLNFALEKMQQISKDNITDPNIIYVSSSHALINAIPEFMFNLNSMLSDKEKRIKFFLANQVHCPPAQAITKLRQFFIEQTGGDLCKAILDFQIPPLKSFPWSIKKEILILLNNLYTNFPFPKILDNREVLDLLDYFPYLQSKQVMSQQAVEKKQTELIIGLIKEGNFEGKLRGLNELKKIIDSTYLTKGATLIDEIIKSQILYQMTDVSTFNKELFRRCLPVFEFAEKKNLLTDEILKRIVSLHKDKHELQLKAYYETLVYFAKFLETQKCLLFYSYLETFPESEHLMSLIKDYTLKAINHHPHFKKKYMEKGAEFGLLYFWKKVQNSEKYSEEIMERAIESFCALITDIYFKSQTEKYIRLAINGIKEKKNINAYLKIIHNSLKSTNKISRIIENLDEEANIVDSVVTSLLDKKKSEKAIQNSFDFLQEVNHYVRKKMTVDHIKMLWKIPECRTFLLKFMRKHRPSRQVDKKSTQKILNKQLSDVQIKEIIEKIFLSQEMMENYAQISDELFQTADELIVAYNHSKRLIQYNYKHTIRSIKPQELFGVLFYLNIITGVKDEQMAKRAGRRFAEFFIRVLGRKTLSAKNEKIDSWMTCVDTLMKIKNRTYLTLELFLEELKGRMKSINIMDSSNLEMVAVLKGKNLVKKTINLPRCTSLWKLRMVLNDEFSLGNTNFGLFFPVKRTETDMEKEEDFSLALIETPKDPSEPSIIITPSKEIHPHFTSVEEFKAQFSTQYGSKILEAIESAPEQQQRQMLDILLKFPPIKTLQKKIEKFEVNSLDEILSSHNKMKLSYQLYVIDKIKGPQFANSFTKNKGIQQIIKILLSRTSSKSPVKFNSIDYPILTKLLKLLTEMLKFYKMLKIPLPFTEQALVEIFRPPQNHKTQILDYFYQLIIVLQQIANYPEINIDHFMETPVFTGVLQILFFNNSESQASKRFCQTIVSICEKDQKRTRLLISVIEGFLNVNLLTKNMFNSRQFFGTVGILLEKTILTNSFAEKLFNFIQEVRKQNFYDETPEKANQLLFGWLKILKSFVFWKVSDSGIIKLKQSFEEYSQFIINEGLFHSKPRFKSLQTRQQAYQVLNFMPCEAFVYQNVNKILSTMLLKSSWRKQYEWFVRSFNKRNPSEQVGLKNLAATCYINSLLQQLFFIRKFSEPLLAIDGKRIDDQENIVYELQKIFAHLKYSENKIYTTESFCRTFILDGQPIDPRIQTDVDEFFHSLMDKLERNLMKIQQQDIIDNLFRGQYANLIVGQECPHKSERIEHFLSMRLQIINKKSLEQALQEFIKGEYLEGDNAYFCEKCDKKVKALKRVCVKSLPQVLILTLKRFEFDFDRMEKFKLNSYCEFPLDLDMFPYMREALYKDEEKLAPEDYKYKLKGTIIHYGISEAGHYTSYIKTEKDEWKYFDDDRISNFDLKDLKEECFGGIEENPYSENSEKLKNSYVLIYEKINVKPCGQFKADPSIVSDVQNQNQRNQDIKLLFEEGLVNFVTESHMKMPKCYLIYLHTVILRSQFRSKKLVTAYRMAMEIFKDKELCNWYLNQFSEEIIKEFLIYTFTEVSHFVASLVIQCLHKVQNPDFIKRCLKCLERKNMVPLNRVFRAAQNSDSCYQKALGQYNFGDRIYKIIKEDKFSVSTALSKIPNVESEFGAPAEGFTEKRDFKSPTELFIALEKYKIDGLSEVDIDEYALKITKTQVQVSFAKIAANKIKDPQIFDGFIKNVLTPRVISFETKIEEEHRFVFYLILIRELCQIKDELTAARNTQLAIFYFNAMKESLCGYKAERYLIEGLFNIAFDSPIFCEKISDLISSQKKITKAIKDWIKDSQKAINLVRDKKLGYWRQISDKYYYVPQAQIQSMEKDLKIPAQKYLGLINSIAQKHKVEHVNTWTAEPEIGDIVCSIDGYNNAYQVVEKAGLLLEVKLEEDSSTRFISMGDVNVLYRK